MIKKIVEINPKNKQGQKLQQNRVIFGQKKKCCWFSILSKYILEIVNISISFYEKK